MFRVILKANIKIYLSAVYTDSGRAQDTMLYENTV